MTSNLGAVIHEIRYGTGTPPPYLEPGPETVPFVRATDIKDGEVNLETLLHIAKDQPKLMDKCRLGGGELIIVRSGVNTGDCAVIPPVLAGSYAAYDLILTFKPGASADFVSTFLDTEIGRLQLNLVKGRAAQPHINAEEVSALRIVLPKPPKQAELVAAMDDARAKRSTKLAEADALLAGLDDFLFATLGLTRPSYNEHKVFAATLASVRSRADADFHSPRFRTIREGIEAGNYPARPLSSLCSSFESGFAAGKQDQAFDYTVGVPHLRPLNLSAQGELSLEDTKFVPKSAVSPSDYCVLGEVLFNNTNSAEMVGKSAVFEFKQACVCSNHMTRLRAAEGVSPHYLAAVFNLLRRVGFLALLATKFNNQAGINLDTLKPLRVPAPPSDVQTIIAAEAGRRHEKARRLRVEAEASWQDAKRWFEEQLLGPGKP